ncbi:sensor histidine kinase [Vibrio sp. SCSIO 43137]|uniref:sensor histidine kinase n=1 Tax=Vibrio sp. SCSIO 43137 TaxID=3021011 RepID=UPI003FCDBBC9
MDAKYFAERYVLNQKTSEADNHSDLYSELKQKGKATFYIFDFELIPDWKGGPPCKGCQLVKRIDGIPIFLKEDSLYVAVFVLEGGSEAFVFSENRDFFDPEIQWYEDSELLFILGLFLSICSSLALTTYIPVRRFQKNLSHLLLIKKRFAKGELSARADENVPEPISVLAYSFNKLADDIEDKIKQSQIFAHAISHEIRTPLSRIQLIGDLIRSRKEQDNSDLFDELDMYINDINELTTNIVMAAKLSSLDESQRELEYHVVDIEDFCRSRLAFISPAKGKFDSRLPLRTRLLVEPTLARLLLDNIIANADKYTKTKVWLSLTRQSEFVCVEVEDDGPGIPEDKFREIFLAFSRLDSSRSNDTGGFGLGLAIASRSAKILDWQIKVSNRIYGGARFTIYIPVDDTISEPDS